MKKRLYERNSKKQDAFILIINMIMIYCLLSWDLAFGDVFALAPGYMLTLIYLLEKRAYMLIILSTFFAFFWSLFYQAFLWLSPVIFIFFVLLSIFSSRKGKRIRGWYFFFYIVQFIFCVGFYNQFQIQYTQFIQLGLYFVVFIHVKASKRT